MSQLSHRIVLLALLGLAVPGLPACVDPDPGSGGAPDAAESPLDDPGDDAGTEQSYPALAGDSCAPVACGVGQCGMVDDGCRAQMWCGECPCSPTAMTCELELPQIWEQPLTAGTHTIIVTTLFPSTIDPILHVISSSGVESAWDDNSAGGTRPRATVTVPSGQTRLLVLRPKSGTPGGAALATIDGQLVILGVRGRRTVMFNLRGNEEVETIQMPGSVASHTIYGMGDDGEHITQRVSSNGTAGGAVLTQPSAISSRVFWIGGSNPINQPIRLIRNDRRLSGHDAEPGGGDGLGSELEAALGLCTTLSGHATNPKDLTAFPCGWAVDARDTDGDGLSDGDEVRGKRTATPHLPLARWGANPRHKDMFAEIDGARLNPTDLPPRMSQAQARYFSDVYGDRLEDLTATERGEHANALRNPDQRPGISTHLDIGLQAETAADYTVYGDWGGYSWVPSVIIDGHDAARDPLSAWHSYLASSRVATFRYGEVWNGSGGQTNTSGTCAGCGSYAFGSSNESGAVIAHESGHANAIAHSGPAGISDLVDPNCKVNWRSIMSYAYQNDDVGFADGTGIGTINNIGVREANAVSPWEFEVVADLENKFKYRVDGNGDVDWNRDGVIAPSSQLVRAYTNFEPGQSCEYTRYNAQWIGTSMNTALSPALARLGNRLFLFSAGQTQLRYTTSTDDFNCALEPGGCGTWSNHSTFNLDVTGGVDVARVTDSAGRQALLVVGVDATRNLNWTMRLDDGTWSPIQWTGIWALSAGEPALETLPDGRALLVFKRSDGRMFYGINRYTGGATGEFEAQGMVTDCAGTALVSGTAASPGLARTAFAGFGEKVWGVFSTDTAMTLRSFDVNAKCFAPSDVPLASGNAAPFSGRPVGVWMADPANAMGGRLTMIMTNTNPTDPDGRFVSQLWSYADPLTGASQVGHRSGFDSGWTFSYGLDAWFDAGVDANLRVVWSVTPETSKDNPQRLRWFPRADGIIDFDHVNYNDWDALRYAVCRNVVDPYGIAWNPIKCPPRPW